MGDARHTGISRRTTFILIGVILLAAAAVLYFGYRWTEKRHGEEINALEQERERIEKTLDALEEKVIAFQSEKAAMEAPQVPQERVEDVFGESSEPSGQERCDSLKNKMVSYFRYLDRQAYVKPYVGEGNVYSFYIQALRDLSGAPPLVIGETRDVVSLTHNSAHFFRVLGKNRILFIKDILTRERDILETTMAHFYEFYTSGDCCDADREACPPLSVLYEYAGFFLNTLSGKSYLMRRDSIARALTGCYSVFIVDLANDAQLNKYGIDIRPHIDFSINDIGNQKKLVFQRRYLSRLEELKEKYQRAYPAMPQ